VISLGTGLAVFFGGMLGGIARFALARWIDTRLGPDFPWGTLAVNLSGALAAGLLAGYLVGLPGPEDEPGWLWFLGLVGFLGSYTTVSAFSLQALELAREGRMGAVAKYVSASLAGCLFAAGAGLLAGGAFQ